MEGSLLKWTNYWNGWQPRWFILKNGYLYYFNTQADSLNDGTCKRSFKVSMFDIIVNKTDTTRMDLIIANDQYLYLKACDYRERQKWLINLASQKAKYPNATNEQQFVYHSSNLLKSKQCELRLYCDLLVQQIHEAKNVTQTAVTNDIKKMDEVTTNINVTCDMLTNVIKNLITLTENPNQILSLTNSSNMEQISIESDKSNQVSDSEVTQNEDNLEKRIYYQDCSLKPDTALNCHASNDCEILNYQNNIENQLVEIFSMQATFFSSLNNKYQLLKINNGDRIPTNEFLDWCKDLFSILDIFGSTAFMPVKVDVYGNINKLSQKYSINEQQYSFIQSIILHEIDEKVTTVRNSATDALLWLKRAIWFLREFFREFIYAKNGEVTACISKSYELTLKKYHNWIVRGIFSLAIKAVPTRENFFKGLSLKETNTDENSPTFQQKVLKDMKDTLQIMDSLMLTLNNLYEENKLDSPTELITIVEN